MGSEYVASKQACLPVRPERRCVQGHVDDCVAAARSLEHRNAASTGYAVELYKYACDEGYAPGCRGLGGLYDLGAGVEHDAKRALKLWENACSQGDAPACTELAHALLRSGSPESRVTTLLVIGCHRGDAHACAEYAERLSHDAAQTARADAYYERACEGGAASACRTLLDQARHDDTLRARQLLELGCRASDAQSCGELADTISRADRDGAGMPVAAAHYRTACEGGQARACLELAELTLGGQGVQRDVGRAAELYARACGAGNTQACERKHSLDGERAQRASAPRASNPRP